LAEKYFMYMVVAFFCIGALSLCGSITSSDDKFDVSVTQMIDADKGLDLRAVGEILKKAKTAEEFEKLLNVSDSGVNNLDLNADGKVDYIKVTEFGDEKVKGFSLTTEIDKGDVQEVATIKIQKSGDKGAEVEYHGNPSIYGRSHCPGIAGVLLALNYAEKNQAHAKEIPTKCHSNGFVVCLGQLLIQVIGGQPLKRLLSEVKHGKNRREIYDSARIQNFPYGSDVQIILIHNDLPLFSAKRT